MDDRTHDEAEKIRTALRKIQAHTLEALESVHNGLTQVTAHTMETMTQEAYYRTGLHRDLTDLLGWFLQSVEPLQVLADREDSSIHVRYGTEAKDALVATGSLVLTPTEADDLPAGTVVRSARTGDVFARRIAIADGAILWRAAGFTHGYTSDELGLPLVILASPADPEVDEAIMSTAEAVTSYTDEEG